MEVAALSRRRIAVRDSKNADGLAVVLTTRQWRAFLARAARERPA